MKRLVQRLKRAKVRYVIMGGMALTAHRYERMTKDVDVLMTPRGFTKFTGLFVPRFYEPVPNLHRRFIDRKSQRGVDILLTGLFPGSGKPGPIAFPNPRDVDFTFESIH